MLPYLDHRACQCQPKWTNLRATCVALVLPHPSSKMIFLKVEIKCIDLSMIERIQVIEMVGLPIL